LSLIYKYALEILVANPMTVVAAANTAAAPMTHFSTTFNLSRSSSCFSSNLSIFNCITVIRVSCEASSPKSVMNLFRLYYIVQHFHFLSALLILESGSLAVFALVSFFFIPPIRAQNDFFLEPPSGCGALRSEPGFSFS